MEKNKYHQMIIRRLKSMAVFGEEGIDCEKIAEELKKEKTAITYWEFLVHSYGLEDNDPDLSDIIFCLQFEGTVVRKSSATEIKLLSYFKENLGVDNKNALDKVLEKADLEGELDIKEFDKNL